MFIYALKTSNSAWHAGDQPMALQNEKQPKIRTRKSLDKRQPCKTTSELIYSWPPYYTRHTPLMSAYFTVKAIYLYRDCILCFNLYFACILHHSADVSDDLKDLLFKMLDKNPENRITIPQIKASLYKPLDIHSNKVYLLLLEFSFLENCTTYCSKCY